MVVAFAVAGFVHGFGFAWLWLEPEVAQFIQRCEAWDSREQKHTRRAACRMHAVRHRDMDVPCGACLRLLRACGLVIQKEGVFLWLLLTEGNPDGLFVAFDKRKLPAALVAEAFDVASGFEGFKALKL